MHNASTVKEINEGSGKYQRFLSHHIGIHTTQALFLDSDTFSYNVANNVIGYFTAPQNSFLSSEPFIYLGARCNCLTGFQHKILAPFLRGRLSLLLNLSITFNCVTVIRNTNPSILPSCFHQLLPGTFCGTLPIVRQHITVWKFV